MSNPTAWRLGLAVAAAGPLLTLAAFPLLSPLQRVMLLLVTIVGGVTLRFSRRYLDGAPRVGRYIGWHLATLAAAATVVIAQDLIVLALAWTATSLSLHQLLTWQTGRAAAEIAAHKKFLLSRIADLAVAAAVVLLVRAFGTSAIPAILAQAQAASALPAGVQMAGALLAFGVILRSAQLPFHGWLIQVMEAPTPVSALLHAGIVNLGAYVMIALSPLMGQLTAAQVLLAVVGALTAILAALVQLTRASVKGALAWSTCAQMGFVLFECGIGAYDLALLHVVAHALYKAHAFLSSGAAVQRQSVRLQPASVPTPVRWGLAATAAFVTVLGIAAITWGDIGTRPALQASAVILALAVTPVLAFATSWRPALPIAIGLPLAYAVWHAAFTPLVPAAPVPAIPAELLALLVAGFAALLVVHAVVTTQPQGALSRALYPHASAGFHLDDLFTRLTFRVWPPTITPTETLVRRIAPARVVERAA